jgi:hypothetical protein
MAEKKDRRHIKGSRNRVVRRVGREIPINLERIMMRAVGDERFRARLLEDPLGAVEEELFELKGSERALLAAMDRTTVEAMVRRFGAPRARRSGFARGVAAAMAGSMIISVSACGDETTKGVGPDLDSTTDSTDPVADDHLDMVPTGILPDIPDVYEETDDDGVEEDVIVDTPHDGSWGIMPDMPEDPEEEDGD